MALCFWVDCRQWKWIWQRQKDLKERGSEIQPRAEGANGRVGTVGIGRDHLMQGDRWTPRTRSGLEGNSDFEAHHCNDQQEWERIWFIFHVGCVFMLDNEMFK